MARGLSSQHVGGFSVGYWRGAGGGGNRSMACIHRYFTALPYSIQPQGSGAEVAFLFGSMAGLI